MSKYIEIIRDSYIGYWNYIKQSIAFEIHWDNYFYGLLFISLLVWCLEIWFPWRKYQPIFRKDFWLDFFYMFFNFFLLNLIVLIALSNTVSQLFMDGLHSLGYSFESLRIIDLDSFPYVLRILLFFVVIDFVQWGTHILLHRYSFLWNFHKVHHSVKEMGFAAHLRYHWMEPVLYNSVKYITVAIIGGFSVKDVAFVHFFNIVIGHLNHANINLDYGVFKYIFNNPKMHIWHHAKELPDDKKNGVNFGITLSIWDFIFKTNYIPHSGKDIVLGFEGDEKFPKNFVDQGLYPLKK